MAGLTIDNPVTLANALASTNIIPGDVLFLRSGTYNGNREINFFGTSSNYITIRNYPGERVILNGKLRINGDYVRVQGLELTNNTNRNRSITAGTVGVDALGNYNEVINCLIHDHDQGITTSQAVTGHVYYGNLVYFNGFDSHLGHGMYPQNNTGNSKIVRRNMMFNNFGLGFHAYGGNGDVSDFVIDGNVVFDNGELRPADPIGQFLNGNQFGFSGARVFNNLTYTSPDYVEFGASLIGYGMDAVVADAQVWDNYFVAPKWSFAIRPLVQLTRFDGNHIIGWTEGFTPGDWPANTYVSSHPQVTPYPTTNNHIVLTDNAYDANRAQLVIYNWDLADNVVVDLSALGWTGQVRARNVQDYWIDVQTLDIVGGSITVNMQAINRTTATPVGWTPPTTVFPNFGAFILEKV